MTHKHTMGVVSGWLAVILCLTVGCAGGWRNGAPAGETEASAPAAGSAGATAAAKAGGTENVTFTYSGAAQSVDVAGEFNDWSTSADPMTQQENGTWKLVKKLAPGRYAYKFVIDGSTWKEDPNATESVDDTYGGKNSIIVVGGGAAASMPAAGATTPAKAGGTESVTFTYSGAAQSVDVAGEFNDWNTSADPMTQQEDGTWKLVKKLAPGRYAYKFVIDGGTWKEDPNATESVDDTYGGKNSIIVVGGGAAASTPAAGGAAAGAAAEPPAQTSDGVRFTWAGAAQNVHLCGDFNDWSATTDAMTLENGLWRITKKLDPGTYQYKFLIDGKRWMTDSANPETVDDGFGGKNSVVTVK